MNQQRLQCVVSFLKTLAEVSRLLPTDNPAMINIIWNRTQQIIFNYGSIYIISRLIEGTYPEYERQFLLNSILALY